MGRVKTRDRKGGKVGGGEDQIWRTWMSCRIKSHLILKMTETAMERSLCDNTEGGLGETQEVAGSPVIIECCGHSTMRGSFIQSASQSANTNI